MRVNLFYYAEWRNFGDLLSPILFRELTGLEVAVHQASRRFLAIGSILDKAVDGDVVWGAGVRSFAARAARVSVHAVRGPLTRRLLLANGIPCPPVYGDPALLLPMVYKPKASERRGIGVLPHYTDRWLRGGDKQLDVRADPLNVVDAIVGCKVLVTSSLHGLIVAEAYGVPAVLLRHREHVRSEPEFKYADYYAGTGRDCTCLFDVDVREAADRAISLPRPRFDPEPLKNALGEAVDEYLGGRASLRGGRVRCAIRRSAATHAIARECAESAAVDRSVTPDPDAGSRD